MQERRSGPKEASVDSGDALYPSRAVVRFFGVLFLAIDHAKSTPAMLPDDFDVSDATLAAIADAALALEPDDRLRATMVRDFRPDRWRLDGLRFVDTSP